MPAQVTLDMSTAKPIDAGPVALDMSTATPIGEAPHEKSWWEKTKEFEKQHGKSMPGAGEGAGLAGGLAEWDKASFGEIGGGVKDILSGNIAKGLHRIMTGGGSLTAPALPIAAAGAPLATGLALAGGAAGGAAGKAGATALGATPDQADLAGDIASLAGGYGAAKGGTAAIDAIPSTVRTAPVRLAARSAEAAINQKLVPVKPIVNLFTPADAAEAVNVKIPGRDYGLPKPVYPGAPLPEAPPVNAGAPLPATPAPEQLNPALVSPARTLPGQISPEVIVPQQPIPGVTARPSIERIMPPRQGLMLPGEVAEPAVAAGPAPVTPRPTAPVKLDMSTAQPLEAPTPKVAPAVLEQQLSEALGGRPLQPGVSLRNQGTTAAPKLPEGFTPVKSTAIRGYKYDPAAQEFEAVTNNWQRYRTGEVTPDDFKKFEAADSKGTAWGELRSNGTPLGKYVGGKFEPYQRAGLRSADPNAPAPGTNEPPPAAAEAAKETPKPAPKPAAAAKPEENDLFSLLNQSLDQTTSRGVQTTITPKDLATRWGVDAESLAATREQTRGMTAAETETYVQKLAEAYKKGKPVEPVLETRDADNNIIEVDGRARAIAAQRAGIKRIPIIVRRVPKVSPVQ